MNLKPRIHRIRIGVVFLLLLSRTGVPLVAEEVSVAVFDGAAPISFTDEDGNPGGIMPEILDRILEDLGHEATFVTGISFQEAYQQVASGQIDILPGAVYSEERGEILDFNDEPFVVAWGQLGVLPGEDFNGLLELRDQRIGLMRDGQNASNFVDLMERFDIPFQPIYYASFPEIEDAIVEGRVAAGVFFNSWFRNAGRIVPSSIVFTPTQAFVATAKGSNEQLFDAIDRRLGELKGDDDSYYYESLNRWLSQDTPFRIPQWVWVSIAIGVAALGIALLFVLLLRREVSRTTAELQRSRERYKTIADYAHGWEFWDDPEGVPMYVSPNTFEITGYPADRFLSDRELFEEIILPEDRTIWREHLDDIHDETSDHNRGECVFRIKTAGGEIRWIEHRCTRVQSSTGAYLGRRGSNSDITQRVTQEKALERGLLEKEVMLQEIHHRVKNNLQMVSSLIALQKDGTTHPDTMRHLETITSRIEAIAALHSTLYQDESFVAVDMRDYLHTIVSRVLVMEESNRRVTCDVDVDDIELGISQALPCGLITNEALINAYKHAFTGTTSGSVHVSMQQLPDGDIALRIADDGAGFSEDSSTGGIGLRLVSALADQLEGTLSVEGDQGVVISVRFPNRT